MNDKEITVSWAHPEGGTRQGIVRGQHVLTEYTAFSGMRCPLYDQIVLLVEEEGSNKLRVIPAQKCTVVPK